MIRGFVVLLACQLAGEAVVRAFGWPVPGPVLGLGLLVTGLAICDRRGWLGPLDESGVGRVADGLLGILALLFVPAGVGIVQHLGTVGPYGGALLLALVVSTVVTLGLTVGVFLLVKRLLGAGPDPRP